MEAREGNVGRGQAGADRAELDGARHDLDNALTVHLERAIADRGLEGPNETMHVCAAVVEDMTQVWRRRRIFEVVRLEKDSGVICLEMMKKFKDAGFRVAEHPVHHYHRAHGKSQFFNFPRIFKTAIDVMKLWWTLVIRREHLKQQRVAASTTPVEKRR